MKNANGIIGVAVGVAITLVGVWIYMSVPNSGSSEQPVVATGNVANENQPMAPIERKPIPQEAADRVLSREIKGMFVMTGRGEDAKWGVAGSANFRYSVSVKADSEILSKEVLPSGYIKVTELRTFHAVQDSLVVSDADLRLALDTLPIDTFSKAIDGLALTWTTLTGDAVSSALIVGGKEYAKSKLQEIDGTSLRGLWGLTGAELPQEVDAFLNQLINADNLKGLGGIRSISNRSYKLTYLQEKSGLPMQVSFSYADGSPVTNSEEKMVLRRVNAFIDYNVLPDKECRPGYSWTADAEDFQEAFDPYVEGDYSGTVKVIRRNDNPNGDWVLTLEPSDINIVAQNGSTTGSLKLESGSVQVDPEDFCIRELDIAGKARLEKLSKHHWLFTARISGWCDFEARLITSAKE